MIMGDNEPDKLASSFGSARDLNEPSRVRQSSACKAREQLDYYFILKNIFYIKKLFICIKNYIKYFF